MIMIMIMIIIIIMLSSFLKSIVYCAESVKELLSASSVSAVCEDSKFATFDPFLLCFTFLMCSDFFVFRDLTVSPM